MNLEAIAPIIEKIVKDTLKERKYPFGHKVTGIGTKVASGNLVNSIRVNVTRNTNNEKTLEVVIPGYGQFVDQGRMAGDTPVPISAIMQWLSEKGIGIRDETGKFVKGHGETKRKYDRANKTGKVLPIAFAIQKGIEKWGIRRTGFVQESLNRLADNRKIMDLLENQTMQDLLNKINTNFIKY
jgi:hypothetical protein